MESYRNKSKSELNNLHANLKNEYDNLKKQNLNIDMSRGRHSTEQLSLSNKLLTCLAEEEYLSEDNIDCRNYGILDGLPEMKRLFSEMLKVNSDQIIVGGNSSLNLMFDIILTNVAVGIEDNNPWSKEDKVKFLCPVPGYDRHFSICEFFNIEMIPINMLEDGPDMDLIENLVSTDKSIKGIWCVPKYSNPDGVVYSDKVIKRFARLKPLAKDFRIYWDNAYIVHDLYERIEILNIIDECKKSGNDDFPIMITSFSKISFGGGGVSAIASSPNNISEIKKRMSRQTISADKINQLRHVKFFKDLNGVLKQMDLHSEILKPRFELVINTFEKEFSKLEIATWTKPKGGYFVSFNSMDNCAKKVFDYCKDCGLVITSAGATFPYGNDPKDNNLRIAPSSMSISELEKGLEIFCLVVKLVSVENFQNALSK